MRGRILWGVAVEIWRKGTLVSATIAYLHADTASEARRDYLKSQPPPGAKVVAVGRVIGYFVDDNQGNRLSV